MRATKPELCIAVFLISVFLFASVSRADVYLENENVSFGKPGQPVRKKIEKNYLISTGSRIEPGNGKVIILDYTGLMMYTLNPQNRTYTRMSMNDLGVPPKMPGVAKDEIGKAIVWLMNGFQITPTNETRTIAGYICRKCICNFGLIQAECWVSKEVPGYPELKAMGIKMGVIMRNNPIGREVNVAAMVETLDGLPVQITSRMLGRTTVTTLKEVEQRSLDPGLFKVPQDYKLAQK
jgi:hypothetical protein